MPNANDLVALVQKYGWRKTPVGGEDRVFYLICHAEKRYGFCRVEINDSERFSIKGWVRDEGYLFGAGDEVRLSLDNIKMEDFEGVFSDKIRQYMEKS